MSERNKLEQVLELLLAEDNERAEELLHEYVVETARAEYERILDEDEVVETEETEEETVEESEESEEEAVEEAIDDSDPEADFVSDVADTDAGIDDDEIGGFGSEEEAGEEEDLEDKVDSLEDELEDLRAEFEKLLSGEEEGEGEELPVDMDMEMDMEQPEEESIEYDLDEEVEEDEEVVEEATKLSDTVAAPKGGEADSKESPLTKKPKATVVTGAGTPVKANDGGEGKKGESAKDHTPTDNIKVLPKKA